MNDERKKLSITIYGRPATAGSKRHIGHGVLIDSCKRAKPWRESVQYEAHEAMMKHNMTIDDFAGPLTLRCIFYRRRPKSHFGTGANSQKLKDSAPRFPTTRPDSTKMLRALEDAMTGVVYQDDSIIVHHDILKIYDVQDKVSIEITTKENNNE